MTVRILVTGASGFIGRVVVPVLAERGYEVHATRHRAPVPDVRGLVAHDADLLDPGQTRALVERVAPSHLLHLAWLPTSQALVSARENGEWADATERLLSAFGAAGGERAVVAGTVNEDEPGTAYGGAKSRARERVLADAAATGYRAAWARVFFAYGPGERADRLVPSVSCALLSGEPVDVSHGRQLRDFVFVEDVAAALAALVDSDAEGVFDIGTGEGAPVRRVVEAIVACTGRAELVRYGARPDDGRPPVWVADPGRLRDETGWAPAVGLEEGIARTVGWWRSRLERT